MKNKDKLPKLYRPFYINIEWLNDSDYGGFAHCQSWGQFSVKVKFVLNELGEKILVCHDLWMKDDPEVVSHLDDLNVYGLDYYEFNWSSKPFKYIHGDSVLTPYGSN